MPKTKDSQTSVPSGTTQTGSELQGSQQSNEQSRHELQQRQGGAVQERREGAIRRYSRDPFEMMQRLSDEMDELFDSFFHARPLARLRGKSQLHNMWAPEVELREEGNQLKVCVDLPGISKDNIKVDVREGAVIIEGERREERIEGGEAQGFRRSERRYGSFYRAIPLPEGAEADKAEARMQDGVLEITVPIEQKQTRRLEIQG